MTDNGFSDFKSIRKEEFDPVSGIPIQPEVSPIIDPSSTGNDTQQDSDITKQQPVIINEPTSHHHSNLSDIHQFDPLDETEVPITEIPDHLAIQSGEPVQQPIKPSNNHEIITPIYPTETQSFHDQQIENRAIENQTSESGTVPVQPQIQDDSRQLFDNEQSQVNNKKHIARRRKRPRRPGCNPFSFITSCNALSCGCGSMLALFLLIAIIAGIYFAVPSILGNTLDNIFNPEISIPPVSGEITQKLEKKLDTLSIEKDHTIKISESELNSLLKDFYKETDIRGDLTKDNCTIYLKLNTALPWVQIRLNSNGEGDLQNSETAIGPIKADTIVYQLLPTETTIDGGFDGKTFFEWVLFADNPYQISIDKIYFEDDNLIVKTEALSD